MALGRCIRGVPRNRRGVCCTYNRTPRGVTLLPRARTIATGNFSILYFASSISRFTIRVLVRCSNGRFTGVYGSSLGLSDSRRGGTLARGGRTTGRVLSRVGN